MIDGPDPTARYPMPGVGRLGFLKNFITNPRIEVGDYTYYDDPDGPEAFERNVLYHFEFNGDRLRIGKFCAIAAETKFIMNGGNHRQAGLSTYPFSVFGCGWEGKYDGESIFPIKGDTVIKNDVWIGYGALIMPGVCVGNGAIIAARSVVTSNVDDYAVVGGNPAVVIRKRFDAATVAKLCEIAWWDWDSAKITRNIEAIAGQDLEALQAAS